MCLVASLQGCDLEDGLGQLSEVLSACACEIKSSRKICRVCRALVSAETSVFLPIAGEQLGGLPCRRKAPKQLAVTSTLPRAQ